MKTETSNELDFLGACGEDDLEQTVLARIADKELVCSPNKLLGLYAPLLVRVVAENSAASIASNQLCSHCQSIWS